MGGVLAHLVCIILLQDVNLFGGVTPAHHLLYDKSATGHLANSWFLRLAFCNSFSTCLCLDEGLLWRFVFQCAPPQLSLLPRPSFCLSISLLYLSQMLFHPRLLCHPILLSDGDALSVIASDHHFHFISRDETFFPIL